SGQLFDRHPVDAATSRVLSNALQCSLKVWTFAHPLHQVAASQALVSTARQGRFHTSVRPLRLHRIGRSSARTFIRLLWHTSPEAHGRLALPIVRPFVMPSPTLRPAHFGLCCLLAPKAFRPPSPFQA